MTGGVCFQGSGLPGSSFLEVAQSACRQPQGCGFWKMGLERGHDFFCFKPTRSSVLTWTPHSADSVLLGGALSLAK